jgi:transmembrane 9 superfamily protein 2/4
MKLLLLLTVLAVLSMQNVNALGKNSIGARLQAAKKDGASKEQLAKLRKQLREELSVARAAGVSVNAIQKALERGATLDDIRSKIFQSKLEERKRKGLFRKKEVTLSSVLFPGVSPEEYQVGENLPVALQNVNSIKTNLPFNYYKLPGANQCVPDNTKLKGGKRKNFGERLMGKGKDQSPPFVFELGKDTGCVDLCTAHLSKNDVRKLQRLIKKEYTVQMTLDGLPVHVSRPNGSIIKGYPLGSRLVEEAFGSTFDYVLHNHLRFVVLYNSDEASAGMRRIVGFKVRPMSIAHNSKNSNCSNQIKNSRDTVFRLNSDVSSNKSQETIPVTYSYEVLYERSTLPWTDRWDVYLLGNQDDSFAHHMSLINSFMVIIFLATCTAIILIRALKKDLYIYNELSMEDPEEEIESAGWKMVHGDVFRPPSTSPIALSVLVGTGIQIAVTVGLTLLLSFTRFLNPSMKGQALTNIVLLYVFSGAVSGYISSRIFKFFGGKNWKLCTLSTALFFPGVIMTLFLILNIFLALYGSAKTVSFFTIVVIFLLWICVASPLVFVGSFIGFKREVISTPTKTNQIARVIPSTKHLLGYRFSSLLVGALPFSCASIEIYFLMSAIWMSQYYYLVGYLLAITISIGITSALISMIVTYMRLVNEDHRWWWKSFWDTGSTGIWLFLYSVWYLCFRLNLSGLLPIIVYLTYMCMISLALGLYTGGVSFLAAFWFNRTIYAAVKID